MVQGLPDFSTLRNANKLLKLRLGATKDDQRGVGIEMDSELLAVENLQYEAAHLQNQVEIAKANN